MYTINNLTSHSIHLNTLTISRGGVANIADLDLSADTAKAINLAASKGYISVTHTADTGIVATSNLVPAATLTTVGGVKKGAHVDRTTGTITQLVDSLVAAGTLA